MRHAVIMAGGAGTRLWPLSRRNRPKQLLPLIDGASLLQLARQRLTGVFAPEHIWVITAAAYIEQVAAALPDVPRDNLIGEPVGRDTANAVGLAANLLAGRDPGATMAVFTADHLIQPVDRFAQAIRAGLAAAEQHPDALITFGITPRWAHTGYGYVRRGKPTPLMAGAAPDAAVFAVAEFKEKPPREVAEAYVRSGEYYWNSGMFVWQVGAILAELARCLPENARGLAEIAAEWPTAAAQAAFAKLPKISIDFGVMERAQRVLVTEMDVDWADLGSWPAIAATRPPDAAGNVTLAPRVVVVDGRENIVVSESDHLLVLLGTEDLVVVHSPDATLVCRRDQVERIKELGARLAERFGSQYD